MAIRDYTTDFGDQLYNLEFYWGAESDDEEVDLANNINTSRFFQPTSRYFLKTLTMEKYMNLSALKK